MTGLTLVFLAIGGIGFLFLLISLAVGDIFDAIGFHVDSNLDGNDFGLLDSRVVSVFLTAFGGFGAIGAINAFNPFISSILGIVGGISFGAIVYYFGKLLFSQQSTSNIGNDDLIGRTGQVTVAIMPNQLGQVTFIVGEERFEKLARSADNSAIDIGVTVKVDSFAGDSILVRADKGEGFLLFTENS
jgi:membrane protein implicated in regulation of membrane protease activity